MTHFPLVTHVFSENENFQDSNRFFSSTMEDFQFVFFFKNSGYVYCKFNAIFPSVTQVWAEKCVTSGKIALNFPELTQFLGTCVTQGMSRNLTDIPKVTHFPLVTPLFRAKKCVI